MNRINGMEDLVKKGEEIFNTYCSSNDPNPVMLPRAPKHDFRDAFPETDQFKGRKNRQVSYEAEVSVYRALENLNENIIVLHSMEYTHHLYRLCDKNHVRIGCTKCKNANQTEGECDFLIICENCFVIIEVKNVPPNCSTDDPEERLNRLWADSLRQRSRMEVLIKAIDQEANVLQFSAFPICSKEYREMFQATEDEKKTIIFKEDIADNNNLSAWWKDKVAPAQKTPDFIRARNGLLAIWASEQKENRAEVDTLTCSFGRSVKNIDDALRRGQITHISKNGDKLNPDVINAGFIKKYVKVEYLNKQQNGALNSDEKLLWIHGPAGAGKTIIMCGKMIRLVVEESAEKKKVVVFKFSGEGNNSRPYKTALKLLQADNPRVKYEVVQANRTNLLSTLIKDIKDKLKINGVVLVEIVGFARIKWLRTVLREFEKKPQLNNCHFFLDDVQMVLGCNSKKASEQFVETVSALSRNNSVWLSCDIAQTCHYLKSENMSDLAELLAKLAKLAPTQHVQLFMNLRNSCDLSDILSVIRNEYIELKSENNLNIGQTMLPMQTRGHYIHGPKTVIHILNEYNSNCDKIVDIFNRELDKLQSNIADEGIDVGIVYRYLTGELEAAIKNIVEIAAESTINKISMCDCESSYSAEWAAVIVLYRLYRPREEKDVTGLYSAIARARVHCSVILYPDVGMKWEDFDYVKTFSQKLKSKNYAQIRMH